MSKEKEKCFNFTIESVVNNYGYVYAKDKEEALEKINDEEWDDFLDSEVMSFGEILEINEQKDD